MTGPSSPLHPEPRVPIREGTGCAGAGHRVQAMGSWDDDFRELALEFLGSGTERLPELRSALGAVRRGGPGAAIDELRRHFHRLAGSGSTFGFDRISDLGRQGERLCDQVTSGPQPETTLDRWEQIIEELAEAFRAAEPVVPAETRPAPESLSPGQLANGTRMVLVVDDDPSINELVERLLRLEGLQTRTASTCAEARAVIDATLPDGLIVDISLPDGTGYGVVEYLRSRDGGDVPAVLMLSLKNDFLDQAEAIHAGADGYFEKPLDWDALVSRLHHLLERVSPDIPRVLVVEDDPSHAAFVRSTLESAGYEVAVCDAPRQFHEVLSGFRPDLILMDINLPELSGYDLARYVRQADQYAMLPIVFLTSEGRLDARIKTVKAGGDDHLTKPVHPALLVSSVAARLERARFLRTLVTRDGLTRLLAHTSFMEQAQALVAQKLRHGGSPAALVMIDIDHFKTINDSFGHQAGDRVLVSLSILLRRHLRRSDIVGRYGGEEFALVLDHLSEEHAVRLIQRLLTEFSVLEHHAPSGAAFRATFSAGVAMFDASSMDLERWIQAADAALYGAKRAGRNRIVTHADWLQSVRPGVPA